MSANSFSSSLMATLTKAAGLHQQGRLQEAEQLYREVLRQDAGCADAWHLLGVIEHQRGRHQAGVELIEKALAIHPNAAPFHSNLGECFRHLQQYDRAAEHFAKAIQLDPKFAPAYNSLGVVRRRQGRSKEAAELFAQALQCNPRLGDAHANMGNVMRDLGRHDEALAHCRQAAELNPRSAAAHNNLANVLKDEGNIEQAISHYRKAIELQPDFGRAWSNLAYSKKYKESDQTELDSMERILQQPALGEEAKCHFHFALGKANDDLERFSEAFGHFQLANQLANPSFDMAGFEEYVSAVIAQYDPAFFERRGKIGVDDKTPVFIVGMPRSGTSLVEQILASHPHVAGVGERKEIALMCDHLAQTLQTETRYPFCVEQLDQTTALRLAEQYLAAVRSPEYNFGRGNSWSLAAETARPERIVDKMMTNYLHLGFIALLFPQAKVIHCRRNPLDVCLSCYFQDFSHQVGFAYDLETLGRYYRRYEMAMEHWRKALPLEILEIEYEGLTADPEQGSRKLIDYCELQWSDQCLRFYETRRVVRTASSFQVRQPMHRQSVEKWRNYEAFLEPLKRSLRLET